MDKMLSFYPSLKSSEGKNISIENYIGFVQHGANQDLVLSARALKQKGDLEGYKKLKNTSKVVTGSCTISSGKSKTEGNIESLNNLIVIDIDEDQVNEEKRLAIQGDKYTYIMHESFGGNGNYCVFIKIDSDRFLDSFHGISEYYFKMFNLTIDASCKNKNRLRFLSYDPDIYVNEKSNKFIPKDVKKFKEIPKTQTQYVYHQDDLDFVMDQIRDRHIDLCEEDYFKYVRIGMAFANEFGESGRDKFHFVCQFGGKYNRKHTDRDFTGFVKSTDGRCRIGTFYYYCKEAGLEIYTPKTKTIINRVKVSKAQGNPTVQSISKTLHVVNEIQVTEADKKLIQDLIDSPVDFSKEANESVTETEQLANFIIDTYNPKLDELTNIQYVNEKRIDNRAVNDIYLSCKKNFDFKVSKDDVKSVINSSYVKTFNALKDFFREHQNTEIGNHIEDFVSCIEPYNEYNLWAFRKWIVGAIHNWVSPVSEKIVCPLTLVLTGQTHGTGKTTFLRTLIPDDLSSYQVEGKISASEKDSMYLITSSLMVIDDEFGGKAFKDAKEYKAISDSNLITQRRPYNPEIETFKRRAILCGTSNEMDILKDVTGNRRILPIHVEKINFDKLLTLDSTGLIMEAYDLYKQKFEWAIFREEDISYIKHNSEMNEVAMPVEDLFFKFFQLESNTYFNVPVVMNQGDLLDFLISNSRMNPTKYDLKEVLVKNKMSYKLHRTSEGNKKGYLLYMRPSHTSSPESFTNDGAPF